MNEALLKPLKPSNTACIHTVMESSLITSTAGEEDIHLLADRLGGRSLESF